MKDSKLKPKKSFKTPLHALTSYLVGIGAIESDADIIKAFEVDKGNFSAYKSGSKKVPDNLVVRLENAYKINFKDFAPQHYDFSKYVMANHVEATQKEKSGAVMQPDQTLLKTIKKQVDDLKVNFDKLFASVPGRTSKTPEQNEVFEALPLDTPESENDES